MRHLGVLFVALFRLLKACFQASGAGYIYINLFLPFTSPLSLSPTEPITPTIKAPTFFIFNSSF
jgi:hypothetical protein